MKNPQVQSPIGRGGFVPGVLGHCGGSFFKPFRIFGVSGR